MRHDVLAGGVITLALVATFLSGAAHSQQDSINPATVTAADVEGWMEELSNWGRWGRDDQLGALNLITPAKRRQAVALVTEGITVSLSRRPEVSPMSSEGDQPSTAVWQRDFQILGPNVVAETISVFFHGDAHTHLDGLCHFGHKGRMYNGFPFADSVSTDSGCARLDIDNLKDGIVTRGILLDIPRLKGIPYLEPGTAVTPDEIEAWEEQAGVRVGAGDVILLHTGRWARPAQAGEPLAGYHPSVIPWLKARDVAVLGSDGTQDGIQFEDFPFPVHVPALVALGVHVIDAADLQAAAETAARLNRWEFLFVASPLRIPGNSGSPFNPIAVF